MVLILLRLTKVNRVITHCFKVDLKKNEEIDLFNASRSLGKEYNVKYNPDSTGIHAMYFTIEGKSFCLYANGSLLGYGVFAEKTKRKAFQKLWEEKLSFFLVKI